MNTKPRSGCRLGCLASLALLSQKVISVNREGRRVGRWEGWGGGRGREEGVGGELGEADFLFPSLPLQMIQKSIRPGEVKM